MGEVGESEPATTYITAHLVLILTLYICQSVGSFDYLGEQVSN